MPPKSVSCKLHMEGRECVSCLANSHAVRCRFPKTQVHRPQTLWDKGENTITTSWRKQIIRNNNGLLPASKVNECTCWLNNVYHFLHCLFCNCSHDYSFLVFLIDDCELCRLVGNKLTWQTYLLHLGQYLKFKLKSPDMLRFIIPKRPSNN